MQKYRQTKGMICRRKDLVVAVKELVREGVSLRRRRRLHRRKHF